MVGCEILSFVSRLMDLTACQAVWDYFMLRRLGITYGDTGSISDRVTPKTQKIVLDDSLFKNQDYKVWIFEQSWERGCALPYTLM